MYSWGSIKYSYYYPGPLQSNPQRPASHWWKSQLPSPIIFGDVLKRAPIPRTDASYKAGWSGLRYTTECSGYRSIGGQSRTTAAKVFQKGPLQLGWAGDPTGPTTTQPYTLWPNSTSASHVQRTLSSGWYVDSNPPGSSIPDGPPAIWWFASSPYRLRFLPFQTFTPAVFLLFTAPAGPLRLPSLPPRLISPSGSEVTPLLPLPNNRRGWVGFNNICRDVIIITYYQWNIAAGQRKTCLERNSESVIDLTQSYKNRPMFAVRCIPALHPFTVLRWMSKHWRARSARV